MTKKPIQTESFNRAANKKVVKVRTPYPVVYAYEMKFKKEFGAMLGGLAADFVKQASTILDATKATELAKAMGTMEQDINRNVDHVIHNHDAIQCCPD